MANFMLYWKVLPSKNLVSSPCIAFLLKKYCCEAAFGDWYSISVKELWPITYELFSFILDILMSKSSSFSLENSLNIFTKFLKVGIIHIMWIKM